MEKLLLQETSLAPEDTSESDDDTMVSGEDNSTRRHNRYDPISVEQQSQVVIKRYLLNYKLIRDM